MAAAAASAITGFSNQSTASANRKVGASLCNRHTTRAIHVPLGK